MAALFVIGIILGIGAVIVPLTKGSIRCIKYLAGKKTRTLSVDAFTPQYDQVLDVVDRQSVETTELKKWEYPEIVSNGVAPIAGIIGAIVFSDMEVPFDPKFSVSVFVYIAIGFISYWVSRTSKEGVSMIIKLLLPYGIIIGILCNIILFAHFISAASLLALVFLSILVFPIIAPFPATLYAFRQLDIHNTHVEKTLQKGKDTIPVWVKGLKWNYSFTNLLYLIAFIIIIQLCLLLAGQPLEGFWLAFRESKDFLFSTGGSNL